MSDIRIPATVVIQEELDHRSWRASLPNGKMIIVYERKSHPLPSVKVGDRGTAHLSLCDFDHGKLVAVEK
jgi:hypothetical protein